MEGMEAQIHQALEVLDAAAAVQEVTLVMVVMVAHLPLVALVTKELMGQAAQVVVVEQVAQVFHFTPEAEEEALGYKVKDQAGLLLPSIPKREVAEVLEELTDRMELVVQGLP